MNLNILLEITKEDYGDKIIETKGFMETLSFGLQIFLLGMITVFAVLALIWLCLAIFKLFFYDLRTKKNTKEQSFVSNPVITEKTQVSSDDEIVAVIAAAIACAENENPGLKFRVVSFRKK